MNKDGALHYTVKVQRTLVKQHVEKIHPVDDEVQENDFIPNVHSRFSATEVQEINTNLQDTEIAENPLQVFNEDKFFFHVSSVIN